MSAPQDTKQVILETKDIVKQFPRVLANNDVNITLHEGEILSLLGENGAGKSTLMNVLYGLYTPTSGKILLNGQEVQFNSPKDAIDLGLGMVHQHFMLL
ncbi:MAG: ATP-binding cassette domain-containing protein, partial [Spirochaetaceae bacterium]|nr:ATP-binding cassette domain-containing protein [Spirochaetaceae bacterium]MCF7952095.1 ATP-binding cassette domain-containing protein [Spirochaetaceae bacterium]